MNPSWMQIALAEQGQAEQAGGKHNPRILEYHAATTLKARDDETPWCASFVSWCLAEAGLVSTSSAAARSYRTWGVPLSEPAYGAIITFKDPDHTGFYMGRRKDGRWLILGGNQSNRVNVAAYDPDRVTAIRWPAGVPLPNAVAPLGKSGVIRGNLLAGASTIGALGLGLVENAETVDRAKGWIGEGSTVAIILGVLALAGIAWSILARAQGKKQAEAAP
ncbi:TIGR02594 family protein [Roseococcus sp. SDR]|uniref:TIGR02594 family protein n=1 Tax=Roseococcus sp. SDR TaxID=2835532 RepID=UPI001BCF0246|nr:TIGR02594 family protein [Roseococcus sp. SDR]MBS7789288.1 TIGR02594 family protein [Roseococcus sp. SDR]MBV1844602.1 TIGR02594 family protein [Roseococcus sp. SDR]